MVQEINKVKAVNVLRDIKKTNGLSTAELAEACDIKANTMRDYIQGRRIPCDENYDKIMEAIIRNSPYLKPTKPARGKEYLVVSVDMLDVLVREFTALEVGKILRNVVKHTTCGKDSDFPDRSMRVMSTLIKRDVDVKQGR